jgi:hypothetical protein
MRMRQAFCCLGAAACAAPAPSGVLSFTCPCPTSHRHRLYAETYTSIAAVWLLLAGSSQVTVCSCGGVWQVGNVVVRLVPDPKDIAGRKDVAIQLALLVGVRTWDDKPHVSMRKHSMIYSPFKHLRGTR